MHVKLSSGTRVEPAISRLVASVTIRAAFDRFLEHRKSSVGPRVYQTTEELVGYLVDFLDSYGHLALDAIDAKRYAMFYNAEGSAHREFSEIFGPEYVLDRIADFLGDFMIRKVIFCRRQVLEAAGATVARLVRWLAEEGLVDRVEAEHAIAVAKARGRALPVAVAVGDSLSALADEQAAEPCGAIVEDSFRVTTIGADNIFLDSELTGEEYGPIPVPADVAAQLQIGWAFFATLGRAREGWWLREIGFVYPATA